MFPDSKNKILYFCNFILLLIIGIITVYNFLYLQEIDKNKVNNIKVVNEVTEIKEIEKKIPIPCIKCDGEKIKDTQETPKEILSQSINNIKGNIEEINGVKHHHYIVPDSEFDKKAGGFLLHSNKNVFQRDDLIPTLMHAFIKQLNPNYEGHIYLTPAFNENDHNVKLRTEIKNPPLDLVGIYFDKGTRFQGKDSVDDWDKYTFDEVVKETNGAKNVYYFWRTPDMFERFYQIRTRKPVQFNEALCPSFAKALTQEDIDNL